MSLVKIDNVTLKLSNVEKPILSDINYEVKKGDFVIILGSNGSGKSSLLKLLDRSFMPTAGALSLNDRSLSGYSAKEFSTRVITLTQNTHESLFSSLTILENYLLAKQRFESSLFSIRSKKEIDFLQTYLQEFNPNLPNKLNQIVDKLSGGEKQALALALSVLHTPEILLLDEHTSALDPKSAQHLMALTQKIITKHHITCMLTTHDLDIALQYGNRILALQHGKIHQVIDLDKKTRLTQHDLLSVCY